MKRASPGLRITVYGVVPGGARTLVSSFGLVSVLMSEFELEELLFVSGDDHTSISLVVDPGGNDRFFMSDGGKRTSFLMP